jgi:hypothetical protein
MLRVLTAIGATGRGGGQLTLGVHLQTQQAPPIQQSLHHQFTYPRPVGQQLRVVRFVKAAKLKFIPGFRGKNPRGEYKITAAGYVNFAAARDPATSASAQASGQVVTDAKKGANDSAARPARQEIAQTLTRLLDANPDWSYDGPHKEDQTPGGNQLTNVDTPGEAMFERSSGYPYVLATRFVLVIYDEATNQIEQVKRFEDCLAMWNAGETRHGRKPDQVV